MLSGEDAPSGESGPATPLLEDHDEAEHEHELPDIDPAVDETTGQQRPLFYRVASSFVIPLTDQTGSPSNIIKGLLSLVILPGGILGLSLPKDKNLPTPWYRLVSSIIGYTYFCAWSISFWPQVILNFKRKSTSGLSNEFSVLNVVGFACYATYTLCFYFSPEIQRQYKERNGADAEITVQSNDVAFAVHALVLCCVQFSQIVYYNRGFDASPLSIYVKIGLATLLVACIVFATLVVERVSSWLDFLYKLSFIKVIISLVKYIPQVILNFKRKSTTGWNIWNIVLDFVGGTLSIGQQIGDSADLHESVAGNPAKFALGFVSIFFDLVFFFQHYLLYPNGGENEESGAGRSGTVAGRSSAGEGTPTEPLLDNEHNEKRDADIRESLSEETPIVEEV